MLPDPVLELLLDEIRSLEKRLATLRANRDRANQARDRARRHRKKIRDLVALIAARLWEGRSPDQAVRIVSAETGEELELIERLAARAGRIVQARKTRSRNREIARLAALGWSNDQIAERVRLHPKSVSRIFNAERRKT